MNKVKEAMMLNAQAFDQIERNLDRVCIAIMVAIGTFVGLMAVFG